MAIEHQASAMPAIAIDATLPIASGSECTELDLHLLLELWQNWFPTVPAAALGGVLAIIGHMCLDVQRTTLFKHRQLVHAAIDMQPPPAHQCRRCVFKNCCPDGGDVCTNCARIDRRDGS